MAEDERAARLQRFVCSNQTFFCAGIECTENSARVALVSLNYNGTFAASESPGTVAGGDPSARTDFSDGDRITRCNLGFGRKSPNAMSSTRF